MAASFYFFSEDFAVSFPWHGLYQSSCCAGASSLLPTLQGVCFRTQKVRNFDTLFMSHYTDVVAWLMSSLLKRLKSAFVLSAQC
jgi:hypothetical protein